MITPIPAFSDNYIWLIRCAQQDGSGAFTAVVDPGDAAPVLDRLEALGVSLDLVLVTHHHPDHVGGVAELKAHYGCRVVGPHRTPVEEIDERVGAGDEVRVGELRFRVLEVPGHTLDHIAYHASGPRPVLFCGDTLFAGGCGRVFEGTFPMMYASLSRLAALPPETEVYCAHEYTLANLAFASAVEPANDRLGRRLREAEAARARGEPTVPSSIGLEHQTNPFLRCHDPDVISALASHAGHRPEAGDEAFAVLRQWKDGFR